jgi:hypothetical protein
MIVLAYLGSQCTKFNIAGWTCYFLCPFIWSRVPGLVWFCDVPNKGTASDFVQISEKVCQRPWQRLDKRSRKRTWATHGKSKLTKTEKNETSEEQSQGHAYHFLWHREVCSQIIHPGRPNGQFRVLLWRFMVTAWKCVKTLPRTLGTKELHVHHDNAPAHISFFARELLTKKRHDCCSPPTQIFCFPNLR